MVHPYWPIFDVVVRTPRLELRYPTDDVLVELARVAAQGVHDPSTMPFLQPWTRVSSPDLERAALAFWWSTRAAWTPTDWNFIGAVFVDGQPVGVQNLQAKSFGVTRCVETGSWIGQAFQGAGIGTEMREAILHLAFEGLGADEALSGAFSDNARSLAVSRKLGYQPNGDVLIDREGVAAREIKLKLTRSCWLPGKRADIDIHGLGPAREWFGAAAMPAGHTEPSSGGDGDGG